MIQVKHAIKKMTTPRSNKQHIADAVARVLIGQISIRFMNGELINISGLRFGIYPNEISVVVDVNSKIVINNNGYHDDGSIWRVKNIKRRYLRTGKFLDKSIVLIKTKKVWRQ